MGKASTSSNPRNISRGGSMSSSLFCAEMVTYSPGYPAKSDVKSVGGSADMVTPVSLVSYICV